MNAAPLSLLERLAKTTPIVAFCLSGVLAVNSFTSRSSLTDRKADENTAEIQKLKEKVDLQQKQLDQSAALRDQLKALADQNKDTQQELHELTVNLQSFESRFIVIPTKNH